uniref:SecY-independent transporter protein n=1 Tax=Ostreobium quekettii TaxID=121088 RepID=A0A650BXT9_9CHLO|nr:SecY-independent transporter protein [Ostreobium quekettii]QGQ62019.1 SecY-independent transporter protein [Ostreobium quekettii]
MLRKRTRSKRPLGWRSPVFDRLRSTPLSGGLAVRPLGQAPLLRVTLTAELKADPLFNSLKSILHNKFILQLAKELCPCNIHFVRPVLYLRHISEIKTRFFYVLFSATITFSICYLFCFELTTLIARPFIDQPSTISFIFTDLTEAFSTNLKICLISTVYLNIPAVLYQIWCFLIPSYYDHERRQITCFYCVMIVSVVLSCLFVHFILLPEICRFFMNFSIQSNRINIQCEPRIYSYVSLVSNVFMISCLFFQIPILFLILFELKIITAGFISKNRKYLIICSILIIAWITPPDIFSEVVLGTFLIVFLELFLLFLHITNVIRQRRSLKLYK